MNNAATWQVTGFGGELLAEYTAQSLTLLPHKEYGYHGGKLLISAANAEAHLAAQFPTQYHGGKLLISAASGDENRLRRFVENIYYRTWGYLPEGGRKQASINALVATLGQNGQPSPAAMLTEAQRQLDVAFTAAPYTNTSRPHEQFVADLYLAYLQRTPEPGAIAWYAAFLHSNQLTRLQLRQEFAGSGEFIGLVNALYGVATEDYTRVDNLVAQVYLAATGDAPSVSEIAAARVRFDEAEAQGSNSTITAAQELGRYLLGANAHGANGQPLPAYRSDLGTAEYVRRLYETFLRRAPDAQAGNWQTQADQQGRQGVLEAFLSMSAYRERGAALYREIQWLISDHLGTPRLIAERTGSAAGIKRTDYLPFGESANALGGRTAGQGYGGESVRQGFTGYEEDAETGLDYAQARYYANAQGRFISTDPKILGKNHPINPQRWNLYTYVLNSPLNLYDPDGMEGKGKGGAKVIDVYLGNAASERGSVNGKQLKGQDWRGLIKLAKKHGVVLRVFYNAPSAGDSQTEAVKILDSAYAKNRYVLYSGHAVPGASGNPGIGIAPEYPVNPSGNQITKDGLTDGNQNVLVPMSGLPDFRANAIFLNACDVRDLVPSLAAKMKDGSYIVYNDAGKDQETAGDTDEAATYAQARTLILGGRVEQAAAAGQAVVNSQQDVQAPNSVTGQIGYTNQGDQIVVQKIKKPKNK